MHTAASGAHASTALLPASIRFLERGWLSSNNVVLVAPDGAAALVVDTGYVAHAAQTVALVEAAAAGAPVVAIANTHLHSDHCGGNAALVRRFGAQVLIPPGEFQAALRWDSAALSFDDTGQQCERFRPDALLLSGERLPAPFSDWEIHAAPGHDPASVVLFHAEARVLMSADALWDNGFGIVFPELDGRDAFGEVEQSLDLIHRLDPLWVLPGHGGAFRDVQGALGRARSRLDYFRRYPERHARSALKALTMFRMLEMGQARLDDLVSWAVGTPVFERVSRAFFGSGSRGDTLHAETLLRELVDELCAGGTLGVVDQNNGVILRAY